MSAIASLAFVVLQAAAQAPAPADNRPDQYLEAVRKGDVSAVKALLDQGVSVDTKFRYDRTALSFAADRGHVEVVKLLLDRGADVNASDTYYRATAIVWALNKQHVEIVRLLLDRGSQGGERALGAGVEKDNAALVALAIEKAQPTADELSIALASAEKANKAAIADQLRKAGAKPLPPADRVVPPETLARYAGTYRGESGPEVKLEVREGVLTCLTCGPQPQPLGAVDEVTFRPVGDASPTAVFRTEGDKVVGLMLRRGRQETMLNRVEEAK